MGSERWLKSVPAPNVSQSDLRRIQQEKALREVPPQQPSPADSASPAESASPAPEALQAPQNASLAQSAGLVENARHAKSTVHLWEGLREIKRGSLHLPNSYVDDLCPHIDPAEQAVYMQLYRLSWGYGNPSCRISLPNLAKRAGMKPTATHQAVKRLEQKGMLEKRAIVLGKGKEQGVEFWLSLPASLAESIRLARSARLAESEPIKEKNIKKDSKGEKASPNFQNCPDCSGTGFHYVDESDRSKGVEKCSHSKLRGK